MSLCARLVINDYLCGKYQAMKRHIIILALCFLASCKGPEVIYSTQYRDRIVEHRDSIYIKEDTRTSERQRNDTVYITTEKLRYFYKDKLRSDTIVQTDSIPYKVEVPVNILTDGQRKQIAGFWFLLVVNIAFVTFKIYRSLKL